jgi:ABC-type multidrug transport system ATPase subunit
MSGVLLSARRVTRRFGHRIVLEPLDLELAGGEVVALGGPNGAGKSTLLAILAGALAPSGGEVAAAEPGRVGWMPQQPALYRRLTARENLELFARLAGIDDPGAAVETALEAVGLAAEDRRAVELSVGNVQRLNLAIGLLGDPSVLLLDEPTASLDVAHRQRLWQLVDALRAVGGAVLFATHNLEEARRTADRLLVLQDGKVAYAGPPDAYREDVS